MIEVISRSFGISGRQETAAAAERDNVRSDEGRTLTTRRGGKDLFDLARNIAFRARKRRIRSSGIV